MSHPLSPGNDAEAKIRAAMEYPPDYRETTTRLLTFPTREDAAVRFWNAVLDVGGADLEAVRAGVALVKEERERWDELSRRRQAGYAEIERLVTLARADPSPEVLAALKAVVRSL